MAFIANNKIKVFLKMILLLLSLPSRDLSLDTHIAWGNMITIDKVRHA